MYGEERSVYYKVVLGRGDIHRLVVHDEGPLGTMLFIFKTPGPRPDEDRHYEDLQHVFELCRRKYGIEPAQWTLVTDGRYDYL